MSSECVSCSGGRFKDCNSAEQDTRQDKSLSKRLRTQTHVCACVCTKLKSVTGLCKGYVRGFHGRGQKNTSEKCLRDCVREVYVNRFLFALLAKPFAIATRPPSLLISIVARVSRNRNHVLSSCVNLPAPNFWHELLSVVRLVSLSNKCMQEISLSRFEFFVFSLLSRSLLFIYFASLIQNIIP